jgi:hypothetical protein
VFAEAFPDGIVADLKTGEGRRALNSLDRTFLVRLLPTAIRSLDEGAVVVAISGRLMTPVFVEGKLRAVFLLPAELTTDRLRHWRRAVNTWHASGRAPEINHALSG